MCLLFLLVGLGCWQWQRYQYKKEIEHIMQTRYRLPPVSLNMLSQRTDSDLLYLPVFFMGHLESHRTFLWDNQVVNRVAGFRVLSLARLTTGQFVIVDRGWVPGDLRRKMLPVIPEVIGQHQFSGILWRPAGRAFLLKKDIWTDSWPKVIQSVDMKAMEKVIAHPLLPWIIVLDSDQPGVFHRQLSVLNMKSSRHLGYAVQWWSMALALIILCCFLVWRRWKAK